MKRLSFFMIVAGALIALACGDSLACRFKQRRHSCHPCAPLLVEVVPSLTADSARQALIEMLTRKDAPNFDTRQREVDALKNGKHLLVMAKDAEGILSGHWNCDLPRKRFSFIAPIGSCLYECHGDFEIVQGRWAAKVTGWSWAYFGPKGPP
jgi:hypothetical protein